MKQVLTETAVNQNLLQCACIPSELCLELGPAFYSYIRYGMTQNLEWLCSSGVALSLWELISAVEIIFHNVYVMLPEDNLVAKEQTQVSLKWPSGKQPNVQNRQHVELGGGVAVSKSRLFAR